MPAQLKAQSRAPNSLTAWATSDSTASSLVTSQALKIALPPSISVQRAFPPSASTSDKNRAAPSRCASSAVARPMPLAAPVISTTLPSRIPIALLSRHRVLTERRLLSISRRRRRHPTAGIESAPRSGADHRRRGDLEVVECDARLLLLPVGGRRDELQPERHLAERPCSVQLRPFAVVEKGRLDEPA